MGESCKDCEERPLRDAGRLFTPLGVARIVYRVAAILAWSIACNLGVRCLAKYRRNGQDTEDNSSREKLARVWVRGMSRLLGTRFVLHGESPTGFFFIVTNHFTWIDFFAVHSVIRARFVVEDPVRTLPIVGVLFRALDPIFVRRVKEDTARVREEMVKTLEARRSLLLAPETPITTFALGSGVRQFRAGLIESAIITRTPVRYMALTYRTPAGSPPPSKVITFGPNILYRDAEGKIPATELEAFGKQHSFLLHVFGVLALPYHEFDATFAAEPVMAEDRITLANTLHDKVVEMFTPIE